MPIRFPDPPKIRKPSADGIRVTDEQVTAALGWLATDEAAIAKGEQVYREAMLKHIRAVAASQSDASSIAARTNEAEASDEYREAIEALRDAVVAFESAKARREWSSYVLDVYRTQEATWRSSNV